MKKVLNKDFVQRFFAGLLIGAACILPGVSGGVLAVSLGIYSRMINAIGSFFRAKKENFLFLLPIGIGVCIGLFIAGNAVEWLMLRWERLVLFLFMGLVIGGIPSLIREANDATGFRPKYLIAFATGLGLIILISISEAREVAAAARTKILPWHALLAGAFISIGTIVPGISTSFVLIALGIYEPLLSALTGFKTDVLFYAGLGFGITSLLSIKSIQLVFNRFPNYAYYCVLGFLIGSTCLAFPRPSLDYTLPIGILLFIAGLLVTLKTGKAETGKSDN
jgi:putative membrane protein